MNIQKEKNNIKKSELNFFINKPSFNKKNNVYLKKYSKKMYGDKSKIIQFPHKKDQFFKSKKKVSWYYLSKDRDKISKRLVDLVVAFIALLILSPIFIITAYKVRKNLGSPVFFYQERPGKNGKIFKMIKFRSMKDIYDQDGRPLPDEQRITPFGQKLRATSLDEMPQLINVLKGDMSIVGPRPMLKEFVALYSPEQARRLEVRPGMTGLAQVSGRNELDYQERFKCDVWYVNNHNLWIDFKIMFKTVIVMAKSEGINAPGHVGPSLFKGNVVNVDKVKKIN
jgi:lipopolysaccharide/colanic/teichoic acid biosynthesis glycosyltransferase